MRKPKQPVPLQKRYDSVLYELNREVDRLLSLCEAIEDCRTQVKKHSTELDRIVERSRDKMKNLRLRG